MPRSLAAILTPHGALRLDEADDEASLDDLVAERLEAAFARGVGYGLLGLGLAEANSRLPPDLAFWRRFAFWFVAIRRAGNDEAPAPSGEELARFADEAPPMRGGEYLHTATLVALWRTIASAFADELVASGAPLDAFLAKHDTRWRYVGRVHFHLAENRKDSERPFAFLATYVPGIAAHGALRHAPLGAALREYAGAGAEAELLKLLEPVSRAGESCAWLKGLIESGEIFHPLRWTPSEAMRLLEDVAALEQAGLIVRMPAHWPANRPSRPTVEATIGAKAPSLVGAGQLLDFSVEVTLDGDNLTPEEIERLVAATDGLAMLRGKWVEVDPAKLKAALDRYAEIERLAQQQGVSFGQAMRLIAGADISGREAPPAAEGAWGLVKTGAWFADTLAACRRPETLAALRPGDALKAQLRPYQEHGLRWLALLTKLGLGACLADDMGLGKTLQVIALLLAQRNGGGPPSLVVAPASLLANWAGELERCAPSLNVFIAHPAFATVEQLQTPEPMLNTSDVVITSYGALLRLGWTAKVRWRFLVIDEAQAIKNPQAKQTRAVKALAADSRIALTGTPIENNLFDLWSIFDFLNPGLLGSAKAFQNFAKRLGERTPPSYAPLKKLVAPYILRRMKTDRSVIADLPDKTEVKAYCSLSRKQAALYQTTVDGLERRLKEASDLMGRRGLVLATLMRLKQICNHAAHGLDEQGRWVSEDSGKFARLAEIAGTIASRQEKLLVFTQFAETIEPLCAELAKAFQRPGLSLSGDTAVGKRKALVKTFQEDERVPSFVLSLKAGGSGLTLTAATHVVHFDRWWNPAVENQATDRAFRIGQKRNVMVHKFICRGTIEERIDQLIESKREMTEGLLGGAAEINLTELGDRELLDLVQLDLSAAMKEAS